MKRQLIDEQFKDNSPLDTVEKIKAILSENGIEAVEEWSESNVPHCYSVRLSVAGTAFGSNGKGLTKEFALASAYGELMERMQLGFIGSAEIQKNGLLFVEKNDQLWIDADLLLKDGYWYGKLSEKFQRYTGQPFTPEQIVRQFADPDGKILCQSFYNLTRGTRVYFPSELQKNLYGSNGCAAGNSVEEAIVQAIGEIVERAYKLKILSEGISVPDIPDEILQQFETVYDIITFLRSKDLHVVVKDCSLGEKFPVVCVCCIDRKTGKYHTHFGANPVLEIALERALTESFQGRNVDNFASIDGFVYNNKEFLSVKNLNAELIYGVAKKSPVFFTGDSECAWNQAVGFQGKNNKELLLEIVDFFHKQDYEILVQDGSCLGFPTCRVVIPGCSEVLIHRLDNERNEFYYAEQAKKVLRDPSGKELDDYFGLILHMAQISTSLPKGFRRVNFSSNARLSVNLDTKEDVYLKEAALGYANYAIGRYPDALAAVGNMLKVADKPEEGALICLKRYLALTVNGYEQEEIKKILQYFHKPETVEQLYGSLASDGNPFAQYTLHCDMSCTEKCRLYGRCGQKRAEEIIKLVSQKTAALEYDAFAAVLDPYFGR